MGNEGISRRSTARASADVLEDRGEVRRRLDRLRARLGEMETEVQALSRLLETVVIDPGRPLRDTAPRRVDGGAGVEYLSIRELAERIPYSDGGIRNLKTRWVFPLGGHYVQTRGLV